MHEHIVVDACSTDGTAEWLSGHSRLISIVEPDEGMYDAINKGFRKAKGEILAYLNCDEQYLPGTLASVAAFMETRPDVDLLFGGGLLVRPDGSLIAYRKAYQPRWPYIWVSHLYLMSCTMFIRRSVLDRGLAFDRRLRANADNSFVVECLRAGCRAAYLKRYLSAFTMTGRNLSSDPVARAERLEFLKGTRLWVRVLWHPLNMLRLTEKVMSGAYWERFPLEYELFTESLDERTSFAVERASFRWRTA